MAQPFAPRNRQTDIWSVKRLGRFRPSTENERESVSQVTTRPTIQLHPLAVLARDDAEAVVLDLVQPLLARRRLRSIDGEARGDEAACEGEP